MYVDVVRFVAVIDAGVCPNLMGDSYRDALKANKSKAWPFGSGTRIERAAEAIVREEGVRRFYIRHAHKRYRASLKKAPPKGEKLI